MKIYIGLIGIVLLFAKCRECSTEVNYGERVLILAKFDGFSLQEINETDVVRINNSTFKRDTFKLTQLLATYTAYKNETQITDRPYKSEYGYYDSYLDNSDLILIWETGRDTLSDIVVKKSRADADNCQKDDPNVRVDKLSFVHKGKTFGKNEIVTIYK